MKIVIINNNYNNNTTTWHYAHFTFLRIYHEIMWLVINNTIETISVDTICTVITTTTRHSAEIFAYRFYVCGRLVRVAQQEMEIRRNLHLRFAACALKFAIIDSRMT